jgi:general secretion pathway protein D
MERKKYIAYWPLLLLLTLSSLPATAEEAAVGDDVVAARIQRSKGNYAEQDKLLQEAEELFAKEEFEKARSIAEGVLAGLDLEVSEVNSEIARSRLVRVRRLAREIRHAEGMKKLLEARTLAAEKRFNDAGNIAAQVVTLASDVAELPGMDGKPDTDLQNEASELLRYCRNMENYDKLRGDVSLEKAQAQNYQAHQKQIAKLLAEAKSLIAAKHYEAALDKVQQVFIFDPLNAEAMLVAGRLYQLFYGYGRERKRTDVTATSAYGQWQWAEPVFMRFNEKEPEDATVRGGDSDIVFRDRLSKIIFPRVAFSDTDVSAALNQLKKRSKEYDPDNKEVEINFAMPSDWSRTVTLNLTNMPLDEIIRYICLLTGLEYRIEGNSILVSDNAASELRTMKIQVSGKVFSDVLATEGGGEAAARPAAGDGGGDGGALGGGDDAMGGGAGISTAAFSNPTPEQWYNFFTRHLITFPDGWKISSDVHAHTLSVTSNSSCLLEIKELLSQKTMQDEKMVMIEIRALEISETDCQELGFNWNFGALVSHNMTSTGNLIDTTRTGWKFGQGSNTKNGSDDSTALSMVRSAATVTGLANSAVVNDWNIFPSLFGSHKWFGSDTPVDLRLTINAMAQNQRVETLSAPKLLTIDGTEASIRVGKTYYFPESWDTLEIDSNSDGDSGLYSYTITVPTPDIDKDGKSLGVYLAASSQVQPDNETIRLHLKPEITAYLGQDNGDGRYDVNVYAIDFNNYEASEEYLLFKFPIWRPRISRRSLDIWVDVKDGEPVVIGGIVDNSSVNRTDKIPILGDLPLIGRIFQSQAENTKKQNLVMFVTARQIDFRGNPIHSSGNLGIPDFKR